MEVLAHVEFKIRVTDADLRLLWWWTEDEPFNFSKAVEKVWKYAEEDAREAFANRLDAAHSAKRREEGK